MVATNPSVTEKSPYAMRKVHAGRNPIVRVGISVAEMVIWLAVMALLSIGMIWLMWTSSR